MAVRFISCSWSSGGLPFQSPKGVHRTSVIVDVREFSPVHKKKKEVEDEGLFPTAQVQVKEGVPSKDACPKETQNDFLGGHNKN